MPQVIVAWIELDLHYTSNVLYFYAMLTFETEHTISSHVHSGIFLFA